VAIGLLAGIGFTVSLLIAELAFDDGSAPAKAAKVGILSASLLAAFLAVIALRVRARQYRELHDVEERDEDQDGIPDVYDTDRRLP
jgi:NhaA family Na+:H+ antiporter